MRRDILPAAAALALFGGSEASAQSVRVAQDRTADLFARDRAVAVRDRPQPAYDALGIRTGGFTVFPRLPFDIVHDDNVFAADDDRQAATTLRLRPEIVARSNWSRHALQAHGRVAIDRNLDFDSENTTDWSLGAAARLDGVRGANLVAGADFAKAHEARTAAGADPITQEPVAFDLASASLGAERAKGRLRVSARAAVDRYDYRDGFGETGAVIEQDDRDRTVFTLTGRADYALSPATAIFLQMTSDDRDYDRIAGRPLRTSSGRQTLAGVDFELGALVRGEIAAGYIRQDFEDAAFGDLDGFGGRAKLSWFPTQLTTVTAAAARTVEDTGVIDSAGALRTDLSLSVDHELLRNLILTAQATYADDAYNGLPRTDTRFGAGVSAVYRINRRYGFTAGLTWLDQSSSGAAQGPSYRNARLYVGSTAQF
ncbi:outer membrane beta-barrel protein [Brevundimonas sp. PWP3-1b1]|uniref:outer membrane beta-barrel protein n=1 Tax=unclassified Brevundimonas TaxID=2622653 RepID=UPI003CF5BAD6